MTNSKRPKPCEVCGTEMLVWPSRFDATRFCGKKCKYAYLGRLLQERKPPNSTYMFKRRHRVSKACAVCGAEMSVTPAHQERQRFCSRACLAESRRESMRGNQFTKGRPGNSTSFAPGLVPWNKGVKGSISANATSFKPGRVSHTVLALGAITIRTDKNGKKRRWIKTPDGWIPFAQHVWCAEHGPIPTGYLVHHCDRDTLNDSITNFELLTRAEHVRLHRKDR